ncbi:DNA helicase-2 / ATP-dependent DNA helicase PcrA [Fervidobacterium changbaicum]|uniref:DNA 3'-5' helicase n=2 Tax=Fervidobacterium TaxID=2422 RepID=A0AAI8CND8_FERIS|nr:MULTISPECIES: ATP-dependent helicase [Fervidobacterium]AMW33706.2 ATP-dependent helicase [Fervidobacterium islandicum]QAV32503.1 ATP-dependent helicase [Fervidobacterium changbaicum]SDH50344.1 DNA helicase-2 / ATP-dependent DNA helicase PcrA [Fervidobacterium changbaicum]
MKQDREIKEYKLETRESTGTKIVDEIMNELDAEQRNAVLNSFGKSVVIAGPGSGKTRVITYKIAYLLANGVKPSDILLVTFTRAAAREMIERAEKVTKRELSGMLAGTFHHVCNVLLRRYGSAIGIKSNFTILDEDDSVDLMKFVRSKFVTSKQMSKALPTPNELYSLYSYMNNTLQTPYEVVVKRAKRWINVIDIIEKIFEEYITEKEKQNVLDYDDLLLKMLRLLEENSDIRQRISSQFKWILVDEFQDTNILQLKIVQLLSQVHSNLFVVADDAQSIYSFRGARFENVKEIMDGANVFKIQTNYRSTDKIVELVNSMIPRSAVPKKLRAVRQSLQKPVVVNTYDHFDEARFIAQRIIEHVNEGANYRDIAVIYRAHSHSLELQLELSKRNIPFRLLSGLRFTETAHAKDVIAFLKIMENPYEIISWMRILKMLDNVGDVKAEKIANDITATEDPIGQFLKLNVKSSNIDELKNVIYKSLGKGPSEQIRNFYEDFYRNILEYHYQDFRDREEDIERLIEMASFYDSTEEFLSELIISEAREAELDRNEEEGGKVTLTTVHQAKGLEWKIVFVIGVNPGDFPHFLALKDGSIDEEERLFYVAITRAKDMLYITHSVLSRSDYFKAGKIERDFVEDIPPYLVEYWRVR